jgi:hypothetical protein
MAQTLTIERFALDLASRSLAPMVRQRRAGEFALAAFQRAQLVNVNALGYLPAVIARVDGRVVTATLAALAAVKIANGLIEFEFKNTESVIRWIVARLRERSPRISGGYAEGHIVLADGVEIDPRGRIPQAAEYVIINREPYARKIEIGVTRSGRPFVVQVENRIYFRTMRDAAANFRSRAVSIGFEYRALDASNVGTWSRTPSARRHAARSRGGSRRGQSEWLKRQPAIIVRGL